MKYAKFWNSKFKKLDEEIRKLNIEDNVSLIEELRKVKIICSAIDDILSVLNRHNYYKLEEHIKNDFNDIFKAMNFNEIPSLKIKDIKNNISLENYDYILHELNDVSHSNAKRYTAVITLNKYYEKDSIKSLIKFVTQEIRRRKYYRNKKLENIHIDRDADVVWLYIANDTFDVKVTNWICKSMWVSADLLKEYRPLPLKSNDNVDDIEIEWNDSYGSYRELYKKFEGSKESVLLSVDSITSKLIEHGNLAIEIFGNYKNKSITEDELIKIITEKYEEVDNLYNSASEIELSPNDIKSYVDDCYNLISIVHEMYRNYISVNKGLSTAQNRAWLFEKAIKDFTKLKFVIEHEREKIR
ncbi:hypothetical protein [Ureibacillus endophyticus]|uniref:hypothetical protein n=1 Tax=Ureibacillus endophyticus TaxID=1978490 RepID=UPI0011C4517C|nr:hypothetical protein [Lysinibacillus endophyticus]